MPSCCVVGCTNRREKCLPKVKFYRFSNVLHRKPQRDLWIQAVGRQNADKTVWKPSQTSLICSLHFVGGEKSQHPDSPSFIPTIFPSVHKVPQKTEQVFQTSENSYMIGIKTEILDEEAISLDALSVTSIKEEDPLNLNDNLIKIEETTDLEDHETIVKKEIISCDISRGKVEYDMPLSEYKFTDKNYLKNEPQRNIFSSQFLNVSVCQEPFDSAPPMQLIIGKNRYKCDICLKMCTDERNLIKHKMIHRRKLQNSYLLRHKRTHTAIESNNCNLCDKTFNQKSLLKKHNRKHTAERPHECDLCEKMFYQNCHLKVHKKTHAKVQSYKCDLCDKTFTQKSILTTHKRKHSYGRSIECDVCQKRFARKSELTVHRRTHTGERPYECDFVRKNLPTSRF